MTTAPGTRGAPTPLTASRGLPARAAILPNRAVLILTGAALVFACSPKSPPQKKGGAPGGPVPVTVATAMRRDIPLTLQEMGAVEASNTVNVRARVGGELTRVAFTEGQDVRPGDLLFTLDARPYEAALQSAQADSARDAARFASAQTDDVAACRFQLARLRRDRNGRRRLDAAEAVSDEGHGYVSGSE